MQTNGLVDRFLEPNAQGSNLRLRRQAHGQFVQQLGSWGRPWSRAKALAPCSPNVALSASVVDPSSTSVAEGATNSSTLLIIILSLVDWSGRPVQRGSRSAAVLP